MPNWCNVKMRVVGKRHYVDQLINMIRPDCEQVGYRLRRTYIPYIPEISYLTVLQEDMINEDTICVDMELACAWSIYSSMLHNGSDPIMYPFATNLLDVSRFFKLYIELYGIEYNLLFSEHYIIKDGILYVNEDTDISVYDISNMEYEAFIKEHPLLSSCIKKKHFDNAKDCTGIIYSITDQDFIINSNNLRPMVEIK